MFRVIKLFLWAWVLFFSSQTASAVDWSAAEMQHEIELEAPLGRLAFSANGQWLAGASASALKVWEVDSGRLVQRLEEGSAPWPPRLAGMVFSKDSTSVEAAALALPLPRQGPAHALALSGQGRHLAWAGKPPTYPAPVLRIWHAAEAPEYLVREIPAKATTQDPVALARRHFGLQTPNPVTSELVEQRMLESGSVRVMLTLDNLKDDSTRALRYRLTFQPGQAGYWELVRVERKHQCWRGPTRPDQWTTRLCV